MKKTGIFLLASILCVALLAGCSSSQPAAPAASKAPAAAPAAPTYPTKDIEVVVPFTAGGGSSITAQIFSQIINEEKILPVRMNMINKPGGNMAVGMAYTKSKAKDPYTILLFTPNIILTPMGNDVGVTLDDFEPIVVFGYQLSLMVANPSSQFKNFKDVIAYAKDNPGKVTVAVSGETHHMFVSQVCDKAGIKVTFVPMSGTADTATAILGGHVDLSIVNLNEIGDMISSNKMVGIGVASKERVDLIPDVPTFIEQGVDFTFAMARGVVAPVGIPEDARQALGAAFKKLCEHPRWKAEFVDKFQFTADPMYLDDAKKYLKDTEAAYRKTMEALGLIDKK